MSFPTYQRPILIATTIVPEDKSLFIPYLNALYEDIANAVNVRDFNFFPMGISDVPADIVNLPNFGAYIICISGVDSTQPTLTASLCKSDATAAGAIAALGSQAGTGAWAATNLTITSTATNFQIAHNRAAFIANFNVRIIGTQE